MNISPVSFRSTTATPSSDFSTLISRPQTYTQKEQPVAAAELQGTGKKKSPESPLYKGFSGVIPLIANVYQIVFYAVFVAVLHQIMVLPITFICIISFCRKNFVQMLLTGCPRLRA